jgi:hypothetical protein
MKNNIKLFDLVKSGLPVKTAVNLTESQVSKLHEKLFSKQKETKEAVTKNATQTTYSASEIKGKTVPGGSSVKMNPDGGITITKEGEMSEAKKKKDEKNPFAICHAKLGPKKNAKFERCVREVKKSLDENNNSLTSSIENKIMELLETHLPPKITKKDLVKYLSESEPAVAPVKEPKVKPGTKNPPKPTKKPVHPGKNPNPNTNPSPKAKKSNKEVSEDSPAVAPSKPKVNPKTNPGTKTPPKPTKTPVHPGKNPNPNTNPSPKANKIDPEEAKEKIIDTIMKMLKK